jgi:hypothetical protein
VVLSAIVRGDLEGFRDPDGYSLKWECKPQEKLATWRSWPTAHLRAAAKVRRKGGVEM